MKENIENMLAAISQGDFDTAEETFQYIMTQKVSDQLDAVKQDVGSSIMNRPMNDN